MPDCFGDEPFGMLECRFDVEAAGHPDRECRREGVPGSMHGIRLPLRLQPRDLASIKPAVGRDIAARVPAGHHDVRRPKILVDRPGGPFGSQG
jgi:hypothetical protein